MSQTNKTMSAKVACYKQGAATMLHLRFKQGFLDAKKRYLVSSLIPLGAGVGIVVKEDDGGASMKRVGAAHLLKMGFTRHKDGIPLFGSTEVTLVGDAKRAVIKMPEQLGKQRAGKVPKASETARAEVKAGTFGPGSDIKQYRGIARVKHLIEAINGMRLRTGIELQVGPDGTLGATIKVKI